MIDWVLVDPNVKLIVMQVSCAGSGDPTHSLFKTSGLELQVLMKRPK